MFLQCVSVVSNLAGQCKDCVDVVGFVNKVLQHLNNKLYAFVCESVCTHCLQGLTFSVYHNNSWGCGEVRHIGRSVTKASQTHTHAHSHTWRHTHTHTHTHSAREQCKGAQPVSSNSALHPRLEQTLCVCVCVCVCVEGRNEGDQ